MSSEHEHAEFGADWRLMQSRFEERRRLLGSLLGGGAAALLGACGGSSGGDASSSSASSTASTTGAGTACIADPSETNGPYPSDGTNTVNGAVSNVLLESGVVRSDIRSSFGASTTVASGVPLTLTITLENTNNSCGLLSGFAIYVWHCDRDGEYSLYGADILSENYLRGVQVTDSGGSVTFASIFPACYSARYPHIHVEVYESLSTATSGNNALLITQLAVPRDIATTIYDTATGYGASVNNLAAVTTGSDLVFESSTTAQLTAQTPAFSGSISDGYVATVTVGLGA
jgi:protocatechuate 3,4-dioxygenase beta subunit